MTQLNYARMRINIIFMLIVCLAIGFVTGDLIGSNFARKHEIPCKETLTVMTEPTITCPYETTLEVIHDVNSNVYIVCRCENKKLQIDNEQSFFKFNDDDPDKLIIPMDKPSDSEIVIQ